LRAHKKYSDTKPFTCSYRPNRCELNPSTALDFTILILSWNFNYLREAISKKNIYIYIYISKRLAGSIACSSEIFRDQFSLNICDPLQTHTACSFNDLKKPPPVNFHHLGSSRVIVHPMHVHTFLGNYYFLGLPLYPNRKQLINCPRPTSITVCSFSSISRFSFFF